MSVTRYCFTIQNLYQAWCSVVNRTATDRGSRAFTAATIVFCLFESDAEKKKQFIEKQEKSSHLLFTFLIMLLIC